MDEEICKDCKTPLKNRKDKKGKYCPVCIQKSFDRRR